MKDSMHQLQQLSAVATPGSVGERAAAVLARIE
jgi:hypothetical protein